MYSELVGGLRLIKPCLQVRDYTGIVALGSAACSLSSMLLRLGGLRGIDATAACPLNPSVKVALQS